MQYDVPDSVAAALTVAVVALAAVVIVLFKLYVGRNKSAEDGAAGKDKLIAEERKSWAIKEQAWQTEREALRADAERRMKEHAESYAAELAEMNDKFLAREDQIRKDFGDRIERIASEASKSAQLQNDVLNKIYERFVGPRRNRTIG